MGNSGGIPLECFRKSAKMSGPERRANVIPALDHATPKQEAHIMTHCDDYNDSGRSEKSEQTDNWKSIGDLAKKLAGLK